VVEGHRLTTVQVATGRKTALMSVVGCRTDESDLHGFMDVAEGYENITVFSELKQ
jgi:ATP-dependent DNA helicase 2 subunit 2